MHLAAYLGKTLLDKNRDLEQKLKRLQKFAEDTLAANQILSRNLAESKEHLQASNLTCEHLEVQLEEANETSSSLRKARDMRQVTLEQKNKTIQELEERIDTLQKELADQRAKPEWRDNRYKNCSCPTKPTGGLEGALGSTPFGGADVVEARGHETEVALLQEIETLKLKLNQSDLQCRRVTKELQEALGENQNLSLSIEKVEEENRELQLRLRCFEDAYEKQNVDAPLMSPRCPSLTSTPKHTHVTRFPFGLPSSPRSKVPQGTEGGSTASPMAGEKGMSLFNELDSHCSHLQSQYDDLLERCTCSASMNHRGDHTLLTQLDTPSNQVGHGEGQEEDEKPSMEKPLRELFDALFSTLKETAQVADRLVERRY